jgi:hypothetical protein
MPKLRAKAIRASINRRGGSAHFVRSQIPIKKRSIFVNPNLLIDLSGDDEEFETADDIGISEDLVDGDYAVLNYLLDIDPPSMEMILAAWRNSER